MTLPQENRWESRPWLAAAVKLVIFVVPFVVSVATIRATQGVVGAVAPELPWLLTVLFAVLVAAGALITSGHVMRRLLPLAILLKLSLVFPDQVPSRFGVALRAASPRRLARQLESADADQATVAERVLTLVSSLGSHDRRTRGHSERVRALSVLIADQMGVVGDDRDKLEWAALLHDLGKLDVPPEILNKKGRPSDDEWAILRQHPAGGPAYASGLAQWMGPWIHAMDQHHERYDGTGYPNGLTAKDITMSGRIVAVADAFEVMTATRSYKKPMSTKTARAELVACAGTHFDPAVVRSFMQITLGDLHKALGPLSWLGSLPLIGPAVQNIGGVGAGVVLGGTAYPTLAAAAALTLMAPMPSLFSDQQPVDVVSATDTTAVDAGAPTGSDDLIELNNDGTASLDPGGETPPVTDGTSDGDDSDDDDLIDDDLVDIDDPDELVDELIFDTLPVDLIDPVDDLARDILDTLPGNVVPDELVDQVTDVVEAIPEIPEPVVEVVDVIEEVVPDLPEVPIEVVEEPVETMTEPITDVVETPVEDLGGLLGGLG
ncbi:MAG: HD domain-containing protein [Acidimicrobiales bacterium]|nr:HD domain-containing protein [Acidimicrobiales bacterium]